MKKKGFAALKQAVDDDENVDLERQEQQGCSSPEKVELRAHVDVMSLCWFWVLILFACAFSVGLIASMFSELPTEFAKPGGGVAVDRVSGRDNIKTADNSEKDPDFYSYVRCVVTGGSSCPPPPLLQGHSQRNEDHQTLSHDNSVDVDLPIDASPIAGMGHDDAMNVELTMSATMSATVNEAEMGVGEGKSCWQGPMEKFYLKGCIRGCIDHIEDLKQAKTKCAEDRYCKGITYDDKKQYFTLRSSAQMLSSPGQEESYLLLNEADRSWPAGTQQPLDCGNDISTNMNSATTTRQQQTSPPNPKPTSTTQTSIVAIPQAGMAAKQEQAPWTQVRMTKYREKLVAQDGCRATDAYVTLCTRDKYLPGILTLVASLKRKYKALKPMIVMVTTGSSCDRPEVEEMIKGSGGTVCVVDSIDNPSPTGYFNDVYSKLNIFMLPVAGVALYLDGDVLPNSNMDDYFTDKLPEGKRIGSNLDCGHGGQFYSGLMLIRIRSFDPLDIMQKTAEIKSLDHGDLGFINEYVHGKKRLAPLVAEETGVELLHEADHYVRTKYCNMYKMSTLLGKWLEEAGDFPHGKSWERGGYPPYEQLILDEKVTKSHINELRAIHYPGGNKPWIFCKNEEKCDTGMGRLGFLDRYYINRMKEFGLFTDGVGPTPRAVASL